MRAAGLGQMCKMGMSHLNARKISKTNARIKGEAKRGREKKNLRAYCMENRWAQANLMDHQMVKAAWKNERDEERGRQRWSVAPTTVSPRLEPNKKVNSARRRVIFHIFINWQLTLLPPSPFSILHYPTRHFPFIFPLYHFFLLLIWWTWHDFCFMPAHYTSFNFILPFQPQPQPQSPVV